MIAACKMKEDFPFKGIMLSRGSNGGDIKEDQFLCDVGNASCSEGI